MLDIATGQLPRIFRCLSSESSVVQGTPQFIQFSFASKVIPKRLQVTFQGGFVGTTCTLEVSSESAGQKIEWRTWTQLFLEDVNRSQSFDLSTEGVEAGTENLKLVFEKAIKLMPVTLDVIQFSNQGLIAHMILQPVFIDQLKMGSFRKIQNAEKGNMDFNRVQAFSCGFVSG